MREMKNYYYFIVALTIFCINCLVEIEAKGGGRAFGGIFRGSRRGGGRSGGIIIFSGEDTGTTLIILLIVITVGITCWCLFYCCTETDDIRGERETTFYEKCHLCELITDPRNQLIRERDLPRNVTTHRRECAEKNKEFLADLPTPLAVHCPVCSKLLQKWPASYKGSYFSCDNPTCEKFDKMIPNTGRNRLKCFLCDYDLCFTCAELKDNNNRCQTQLRIHPPVSQQGQEHNSPGNVELRHVIAYDAGSENFSIPNRPL